MMVLIELLDWLELDFCKALSDSDRVKGSEKAGGLDASRWDELD